MRRRPDRPQEGLPLRSCPPLASQSNTPFPMLLRPQVRRRLWAAVDEHGLCVQLDAGERQPQVGHRGGVTRDRPPVRPQVGAQGCAEGAVRRGRGSVRRERGDLRWWIDSGAAAAFRSKRSSTSRSSLKSTSSGRCGGSAPGTSTVHCVPPRPARAHARARARAWPRRHDGLTTPAPGDNQTEYYRVSVRES